MFKVLNVDMLHETALKKYDNKLYGRQVGKTTLSVAEIVGDVELSALGDDTRSYAIVFSYRNAIRGFLNTIELLADSMGFTVNTINFNTISIFGIVLYLYVDEHSDCLGNDRFGLIAFDDEKILKCE